MPDPFLLVCEAIRRVSNRGLALGADRSGRFLSFSKALLGISVSVGFPYIYGTSCPQSLANFWSMTLKIPDWNPG
jgi:hypothetical protein